MDIETFLWTTCWRLSYNSILNRCIMYACNSFNSFQIVDENSSPRILENIRLFWCRLPASVLLLRLFLDGVVLIYAYSFHNNQKTTKILWIALLELQTVFETQQTNSLVIDCEQLQHPSWVHSRCPYYLQSQAPSIFIHHGNDVCRHGLHRASKK